MTSFPYLHDTPAVAAIYNTHNCYCIISNANKTAIVENKPQTHLIRCHIVMEKNVTVPLPKTLLFFKMNTITMLLLQCLSNKFVNEI